MIMLLPIAVTVFVLISALFEVLAHLFNPWLGPIGLLIGLLGAFLVHRWMLRKERNQ